MYEMNPVKQAWHEMVVIKIFFFFFFFLMEQFRQTFEYVAHTWSGEKTPLLFRGPNWAKIYNLV